MSDEIVDQHALFRLADDGCPHHCDIEIENLAGEEDVDVTSE